VTDETRVLVLKTGTGTGTGPLGQKMAHTFRTRRAYCNIVKSEVCISRSCPILVLTTVLGRPRRASAKNDFKKYQDQLLFSENPILKY
jgi:hypothetical protein